MDYWVQWEWTQSPRIHFRWRIKYQKRGLPNLPFEINTFSDSFYRLVRNRMKKFISPCAPFHVWTFFLFEKALLIWVVSQTAGTLYFKIPYVWSQGEVLDWQTLIKFQLNHMCCLETYKSEGRLFFVFFFFLNYKISRLLCVCVIGWIYGDNFFYFLLFYNARIKVE